MTIIFCALAFVFTRLALQYFDVYTLSFLRYLAASITLLIIICFIKINKPKKKDLPTFILSGALGFFIYVILFNKGTALVSAATSSIVIAMVPVFTAFLATFFYKEKLKIYQWFAIGIEFIGILVLTLMNGSFSINEGVLWLLIAALSLAAYNVIQRKLTKTYSALESSTYSIFFATIMLCIFLPNSISKTINTPFLTTILGFIIIGEIPDKATILGGIIILTGLFLFNKESFLEPFRNKDLSSNECSNDDI